MKRFFEASALASLFVKDSRTERVRSLFHQSTQHFVSTLSLVEVPSGIARAFRNHRLRLSQYNRLKKSFHELQPYLVELEITLDVVAIAQDLVAFFPLKASDAIQLATFEIFYRHYAKDAVMVCGDERIVEAGKIRQLPIINVK